MPTIVASPPSFILIIKTPNVEKTHHYNYIKPFVKLSRAQGKGLQRCGPRVKPGSVGECEGMNPTLPSELPLWELVFQWTPESSRGNFRGQNSLD